MNFNDLKKPLAPFAIKFVLNLENSVPRGLSWEPKVNQENLTKIKLKILKQEENTEGVHVNESKQGTRSEATSR